MKRTQPNWSPPERPSSVPKLRLFNSLTRKKEEFVPQNGNRVLWYSCGPTVYDEPHMGHARSYISFDILRRVLMHYFNYDVLFVMNITDVDDKIIKMARQHYLLQEYIKGNHSLEKILNDISAALKPFEAKLAIADQEKKQMMEGILDKVNAAVAQSSSEALFPELSLIAQCKDLLVDWLDIQQAHTVYDNLIFSTLPKYLRAEFYKDMNALNVLRPDVVTLVSEYVPEIVDYTQKIIDNNFAYHSNGSVYFDTAKFDQDPSHHYAKLVPEAFCDSSALHEDEGDLSVSEDRLNEKRSPNDFALWKASKPREPSWPSPWGKGRPGWHIGCSAMASAILGPSLDIHTGGCDFKFPHHDNELAQAEAYFGNNNWVRYFLHSGHLTVAGCKMSKSLKNFTTIKDALLRNSSRQLRFAFLLHAWNDNLDYSENTLESAVQYEKTFNEFFSIVKDSLRNMRSSGVGVFQKYNSEELFLNTIFEEAKTKVHEALCDNIDTKSALGHLRDLVTSFNLYLHTKKSRKAAINGLLLENCTLYISHILAVFGTIEVLPPFGFPISKTEDVDKEEIVRPHLTAVADFRDEVMQMPKLHEDTDMDIFSDERRDEFLRLLVRLEDHEGVPPVAKLVEANIPMKEQEQKLWLEEEKKQQQLEVQAANEPTH